MGMQRGKLAVITGPSGAGKDEIMKLFLAHNPDWVHPPTATTRPLRGTPEEDPGVESVSLETFMDWQQSGQFIESDEVFPGRWYGTRREPVIENLDKGRNVLLRLEVDGTLNIKAQMPEAITIFIRPENFGVLEKRLDKRDTETEAEIQERLDRARREMDMAPLFGHIIVNRTGELYKAVEELEGILA